MTAHGIYTAFLLCNVQLQIATFHSGISGYGVFKVNFIIIS